MLIVNSDFDADKYLGSIIKGEKKEHLDLILRYQPDILSRKTLDPSAWWDNSTFKSPEIARWLLNSGLDPNLANWLGINRLHRCAAKVIYQLQKLYLNMVLI
jgi:ankyrin repeat protein